jgi:hypothetical protein
VNKRKKKRKEKENKLDTVANKRQNSCVNRGTVRKIHMIISNVIGLSLHMKSRASTKDNFLSRGIMTKTYIMINRIKKKLFMHLIKLILASAFFQSVAFHCPNASIEMSYPMPRH